MNSGFPDTDSSVSETRHESGHDVTAHARVGVAQMGDDIMDQLFRDKTRRNAITLTLGSICS